MLCTSATMSSGDLEWTALSLRPLIPPLQMMVISVDEANEDAPGCSCTCGDFCLLLSRTDCSPGVG